VTQESMKHPGLKAAKNQLNQFAIAFLAIFTIVTACPFNMTL